jgi:hypothetical protein
MDWARDRLEAEDHLQHVSIPTAGITSIVETGPFTLLEILSDGETPGRTNSSSLIIADA